MPWVAVAAAARRPLELQVVLVEAVAPSALVVLVAAL